MRKIYIFAVCLFISATLKAQTAPVLLVDSDPRAFAQGLSVPEISDLVFSEKKFEVSLNYGFWAPESIDNTIAGFNAFYKLSDQMVLGFKGKYLSDKQSFTGSLPSGGQGKPYKPSDMEAELSFGYRLTERFSVGVGAKMLNSVLSDELKGSSFAADISASYGTKAWVAGLSVCNIGSKLSYGGSSYPLPMLVKVQGQYRAVENLTASAQAQYLFDGVFLAGCGLEYELADIVDLRAAYFLGNNERALPSFASVGIGAHFAGLELNVAYLLASEALAGTMTFGLGYSF